MKKLVIGSALAVGLLLSGAGQAPASASTTGMNLGGLDIESAMMMVQSQRASLLEAQSRAQMEEVHARNSELDMLRLQSLSNKRNEAFDVMTNFIKKMQEQRSSIIENMR